MNRGGAEAQSENQIIEAIIGCAIEVHRTLGPGLLESAYEECLCYELSSQGLYFRRQVALPVSYKNIKLDCGYMLDLVVNERIIIELKTVEKLAPIHEAQLLTYLKLYPCTVGLLINFNVPILKLGIKRLVNQFQETSAPPRLCG
ncbi:GxxExxY protein [Sulfurirhabdus autotrophica]|uniref:GxxExxY protein n=1 Tax=Sulfurirhabdus autotrophica TaxID=1706046 RepID=A0A4R3Y2Y0_9PROT|nr:GxxExxY protein [Sulfurirhabdus autotrophica]TCV84674.1 GxxExxY protein [Sulfurirhabdus autotrophica]